MVKPQLLRSAVRAASDYYRKERNSVAARRMRLVLSQSGLDRERRSSKCPRILARSDSFLQGVKNG